MSSPHALGIHGGPVIGTYRSWVRGEPSTVGTWLDSCDDGLVLRLLAGTSTRIYPLTYDSAPSITESSNTLESLYQRCLPNPNVRLGPQVLDTQGPQVRSSKCLSEWSDISSASLETLPPLGCSSAHVKYHGDDYGQGGCSSSASGVYQVQGGFDNGSPFPNRKGNSGNSSREFDRRGSGGRDGSQSMAETSVRGDTKLRCPYLIYEHLAGQKGANGCEWLFPDFIALRNHVLSVHIKAHQCTRCYCGFFGTTKALDRHKLGCEAKAAPANPVRREVLEFSDRIWKCKNLDSLTGILYRCGVKQFDRLDGTDNLRWSSILGDDVPVDLPPCQATPQAPIPAAHLQLTPPVPSMASITPSTRVDRITPEDSIEEYMEISNESQFPVQNSPSVVGDSSNTNPLQNLRQDSTLPYKQDAHASSQGNQEVSSTFDSLAGFAKVLGAIELHTPPMVEYLIRDFKRNLSPSVVEKFRKVFLEDQGEKGSYVVGAADVGAADSVPVPESEYSLSPAPRNSYSQNYGGCWGTGTSSNQKTPFRRDRGAMELSTADTSSIAETETESIAYSYQGSALIAGMGNHENFRYNGEQQGNLQGFTFPRKKRPRNDD